MDDDDGHTKNGGTGQIGPRPSTDATVWQTPTQPGVPAWLFARNNSVHAPVFGQPSERKSTSCKPPSMPSFAFGSRDSQSPFRAAISTNNTNSKANEAKDCPQSPNPSPSVDLDTLNDDQALALLLKNETVAGLLQKAFNTRVEEHQQKLVGAFNQRLVDLEEYTRCWRDTTKELWLAVREGTFNPDNAQRETLSWKGPQEAGHDFNSERPMASQEIVEKELDSDGRVACISVKNSSAAQSGSHFSLLNWINSGGCGSKDFKNFGHKIAPFNKKYPPRIVFRHKNKHGNIRYRAITSIESPINNMTCNDVFIELTPSNVSLLGKAFCYLKNTRDRISSQVDTADVSAAELSFLFNHFSRETTQRHIDVLPLYNGKEKLVSDLFAANINFSVVPKRLLIARPRYTIGGDIIGAKFFDVGSGAYTTRKKSDEDVILFEDKVAFNRLARLLSCINKGIVHVPLSITSPVPSHSKIPAGAGYKSAGIPGQTTCHSPPSVVPNITQKQEKMPASESLALPQASLFQRTLALSDGLKELGNDLSPDQPDPQPQNQWLTIGGEPGDVRSPSPSLEQENSTDTGPQLPIVEEEVFPFGLAIQHGKEDPSDVSENSDLIILDGRPENVTFRRGGKRPLSPAGQEAEVAKKAKLSVTKPSKQLPQIDPHGHVPEALPNLAFRSSTRTEDLDKEQLSKPAAGLTRSQDDTEHKEPQTTSTAVKDQPLPLGEQNFVEALNHQPPSEMIATLILKHQQQLRQLRCLFTDISDQIDEGTVGGTIQNVDELQTDMDRAEGILKIERQFEDSQNIDGNLRRGARLPSLGVSDQAEHFSAGSDALVTKAECAKDTQTILTDQNENMPVQREKSFSSIKESSSLAAPAVPKQSPRTIPTEPKAFRGVPKEPKAMRAAVPQQYKTRGQYRDNHRAVSVGPHSHHQPLQANISLDKAQRSSLATPNQIDAAHGSIYSGVTAPQNHRKPLRAVSAEPWY